MLGDRNSYCAHYKVMESRRLLQVTQPAWRETRLVITALSLKKYADGRDEVEFNEWEDRRR